MGPYELIARLAQGGMAELYLARSTGAGGFEKVVVLKRILPVYESDPDFVRMFLAEARLAATLDHPNLVNVRDVSSDGERPFLTMDYIHGRSLLELARHHGRAKDPIPLEVVVGLVIAVCRGLHHAHQRADFQGAPLGIVHRDITPTNIMLTYEGLVKVIDFGIARAAKRTSMTAVGQRKGKVAYMSPEQCAAEDLDARSDVFSIGIVLYELATMSRLFRGDDDLIVVNQIINASVQPPRERNPALPQALDDIILKALARDRNDRWASAVALARALETLARELRMDVSQARIERHMRECFEVAVFPWLVDENRLPTRAPAATLDPDVGAAPEPGGATSSTRRWMAQCAICAVAIFGLVFVLRTAANNAASPTPEVSTEQFVPDSPAGPKAEEPLPIPPKPDVPKSEQQSSFNGPDVVVLATETPQTPTAATPESRAAPAKSERRVPPTRPRRPTSSSDLDALFPD